LIKDLVGILSSLILQVVKKDGSLYWNNQIQFLTIFWMFI
jgi:hypothetical protein